MFDNDNILGGFILIKKELIYLIISKLIHVVHTAGLFILLISYLFLTSWVEFVIYTAVIINLFHPGHGCFLTYIENKFRKKAGLKHIVWLKFYFLKGNKPWRLD